MSFVKKDVMSISMNPFEYISKKWFLLTSGSEDCYNTMTAGWGQVGVMWGKPVFTVVVRPNRKTFELIEENEYFTVSFFSNEQREVLKFCGSHSGRDCDKVKETGLTPKFTDGSVAFEEAEMILVCKKVYEDPLEEKCFIDRSLLAAYEKEPYHKSYTGEIVAAYVRE